MENKFRLLVLAAFFAFAGSQAIAATGPRDGATSLSPYVDLFVARIAENWTEYRVCEFHGTQQPGDTYLSALFPGANPLSASKIHRRQIWVRQDSAQAGSHLGLVALEFATATAAAKVFARLASEEPGRRADGKVLTMYAVRRDEANILLVYSETFLDEAVRKFIEEFPSMTPGQAAP